MIKKSGLRFSIITIPIFTIFHMFFIQYIGIYFLYFGLDKYRMDANDKGTIFIVFLLTSSVITLMILGFIVARKFHGELPDFKISNSRAGFIDVRKRAKLLFLEFCGILSFILYINKIKIDKISIFAFFGFSNVNYHVARSLMTNSFQGKHHWYIIFYRDILSFCFFCFLSSKFSLGGLRDRKNSKCSIINNEFNIIFLFFIVLFVCLMTTQKGPLGNFLMACFCLFIVTKYNGKIRFLMLVNSFFITFCFLIISYFFFMNQKNLLNTLYEVLSRIFCGQIHPAYYYIKMFPDHHDWLYGRSFPNFGGIFPFENYPLTFKVMNFMSPGGLPGVVGSAPTVYWGELYANWGYLGVFIPPFFIGYYLYWINKKIFNLQKTPLNIAFFICIMFSCKNLAMTSISSFIFDFYLAGLVLCMIFLREWNFTKKLSFLSFK